jgi:hypothetical protein
MRKSILALAFGGALAATAFSAVPASAGHTWSPEFGWRTGHVVPRPPARRTVVINPDGSRTVIRQRPGRTVVRHPDGSRTVYQRQQAFAPPPPRYYGY